MSQLQRASLERDDALIHQKAAVNHFFSGCRKTLLQNNYCNLLNKATVGLSLKSLHRGSHQNLLLF
jgi:hypothetical protein